MNALKYQKEYDIAIIGAGISGLTSSALLSRAGYKCCVLEMDTRPGGYLAGFRRKDFRFDSAIHWLNQCGPKGSVTKTFNIIGNDYPKAHTQNKIKRTIVGDMDYMVTKNPDELRDQWINEFPEDKKGIIRFFNDAKKIAKSFDDYIDLWRSMDTMNLLEKGIYGLKLLKFALPFIPHVRYNGKKMEKGLRKYFSNPKLRQAFSSEQEILSCLVPLAWAYSEDFQTPPDGGGQVYPEWLLHATRTMDSDVLFGCRVNKVLVNNKEVSGIRFQHKSGEHQIKCKYVVAACDVETLYEKMLDPQHVPESFKKKLKSAEIYSSAVTISLGLDCPAEKLGLGEEMVYLASASSSRDELNDGDPYTSGIHVIAGSSRDKSLAPEGKGTMTIFMPAYINNHNYWGCEIDAEGNYNRTEEYKTIKERVSERILTRIEETFIPNLREHIVYKDVATPITHWRYTGNKNGTMMGAKPGKANMKAKIAHYETPVKNLYLSGHWSELGGGIPLAVKPAVNTSLMILKKDKNPLFKPLCNYMDGKLSLDELRKVNGFKHYPNNYKQDPTPATKKELNKTKYPDRF